MPLFTILEKLKGENYYWTVGFYSLCTAGVTHFFFLLLFIYLQITPLIYANIISVLIYFYIPFCLAEKVLETKNDNLIGWIVFVELILHALISVYCLGTATGFQNYVYVLAFLPFFIATYSTTVRLIRFFSIIALSITIEVYGYYNPAAYHVDKNIIFSLHIMNLFFFIVILGGISFLYFQKSMHYQNILLEESSKDPLTKLFNRRFIVNEMEKELPGSLKNGSFFSVILIDVDFFKNINDTFGHNAGDMVLVSFARVLQQNTRSENILSRWGGEEFLVSCSVTDKTDLKILMERLKTVVENLTIDYEGQEITITIILGGAILRPGEQFSELVNRADIALYTGKEQGRNQGVIAA